MDLIKSIMDAVGECWGKGHKVYIAHAVTDADGNYIETQTFPYGRESVVPGTKAKIIQIDVSCSACKMFEVDEQSGDFVYDIGVDGRQFIGNIHPSCVLAVIDKTTGNFVWDVPARKPAPNYSQGQYRMVNQFPELAKQRISVSSDVHNRASVDAKFDKFAKGLSLAASNDNPKPAKGNVWTPRIV